MEIDGHPTQDIIEELERRGAAVVAGASSGPRIDALRFLTERLGEVPGMWLFLPTQTYQTGFDDIPH